MKSKVVLVLSFITTFYCDAQQMCTQFNFKLTYYSREGKNKNLDGVEIHKMELISGIGASFTLFNCGQKSLSVQKYPSIGVDGFYSFSLRLKKKDGEVYNKFCDFPIDRGDEIEQPNIDIRIPPEKSGKTALMLMNDLEKLPLGEYEVSAVFSYNLTKDPFKGKSIDSLQQAKFLQFLTSPADGYYLQYATNKVHFKVID